MTGGALLTPIAAGLSLQVAPIVAPLALYGLLGMGFGYRWPDRSWRWGLWIILGQAILIAATVVAVGLFLMLARGSAIGSGGSFAATTFDFVRTTVLMAGLPGLAGACGGAWAGAAWTRKRGRGTVA